MTSVINPINRPVTIKTFIPAKAQVFCRKVKSKMINWHSNNLKPVTLFLALSPPWSKLEGNCRTLTAFTIKPQSTTTAL